MKLRHQQIRPMFAVFLLLMLGSLSLVVGISWYNSWAEVDMFESETWNVRKINDQLWRMNGDKSLPIPPSARNIWYEGHTVRGSNHLTLGFEADSDEARAFADQFCNGQLRESYDPYVAIDTQTPVAGAIHISQGDGGTVWEYYSYSKDIPPSTLGMRCMQAYTHQPNRRAVGKYHAVPIAIRVEVLSASVSRVQMSMNRDGAWDNFDPVVTPLTSEIIEPWFNGR